MDRAWTTKCAVLKNAKQNNQMSNCLLASLGVGIELEKDAFHALHVESFFYLFRVPTMSTDFQLNHELPKLRIAAAKNDDVPSDDVTSHHDRNVLSSVVTLAENDNDNDNDGEVSAATVDEDESYRTPTSKESKIPAVTTCPPAPKKPKPFASCKRKLLDEFQFFDDTNKEDMDAFFRSTFPKRSCTCT
ncbi:hypothetical protein VNO78_19916 [Psophocarpus tetragonolobus]|uniref:Uncharacterized protein n=1 Tax=Psophocarpus tetragonolobus TaxID=3891 RepID=A0AAN9S9F6_PSOTE